MARCLRIGKTKILKNPVPESELTPLGFWREALTNKKHSRTRSVRLMFAMDSKIDSIRWMMLIIAVVLIAHFIKSLFS